MWDQVIDMFTRLAELISIISGEQLRLDPYSDALLLPLTADEVLRRVPPKHSAGWITMGELRNFDESQTMKEWRRQRRINPETRGIFLSHLPEAALANKSPHQLAKCREYVAELEQEFAGDRHMQAVLKRHRHFIRKRLRDLVAAT
jgi:hypothetical protein